MYIYININMSERKKSDTYKIWDYKMKLEKVNLTLQGHSRGSEK